jgi:hypothetical protein
VLASDLRKTTRADRPEYILFMKYATGVFLDSERLWRKDSHGVHQLFIPKDRRIMVLRELHNNIGHRHFM